VCCINFYRYNAAEAGRAVLPPMRTPLVIIINWRGDKPMAGPQRPIHNSPLQSMQQERRRTSCWHGGSVKNTPNYQQFMSFSEFSQWQLRHTGHLASRPQDWWTYWRTAWSTVSIPADQCGDSKVQFQYSFTRLSQLRTTPTRSHSGIFETPSKPKIVLGIDRTCELLALESFSDYCK